MAQQQPQQAQAPAQEGASKPAPEAGKEAPKKKGLPIKTLVMIVGLMAVEGIAIFGAMSVMGKPSGVHGAVEHVGEQDPHEDLVELPVLNERFVNNADGRLWVWDTEIMVVVKEKHHYEVEEKLAKNAAKIRTGIGTIWSAGRLADFNEPGRVTLSNQVLEYLRTQVFEKATVDEEDRIVEVLIPKCMGFPADY